jgi:excisionase family DNA binding protein
MNGMLVLAVDHDLAGHLATALQLHRNALAKHHMPEPPGLADLQEMALQIVRSSQEASPSVTTQDVVQDDSNERDFLTRQDIKRRTGTSLSTIDRWIRNGELPSSKHGRVRRINRTDLDQFLTA